MNQQHELQKNTSLCFRKSLRKRYKHFEECQKVQKESARRDYSQNNENLQRMFDNPFGDDEE